MQWMDIFKWLTLTGIVEIFVLSFFVYYVLSLFRGTRGAPILSGFLFVFISSIVLTRFLHLDTLNWLLGRFSVYLAVAVLVIFQPEIRQALAELGKKHLFGTASTRLTLADQIAASALYLSARRIGALIAVEQAMGTRAIQETGTRLDCIVSTELLSTIFFPYTPLHDGGVIIEGDRIAAAGCMFPLTERENLDRSYGARHRAALGLADESDAVIVVVSEETGAVAVGHHGRLHKNLTADQLRQHLNDLLVSGQRNAKKRVPAQPVVTDARAPATQPAQNPRSTSNKEAVP